MKIRIVPIAGILQKVLIIEEGDEPKACENCAKPFWNHPKLAKEDNDWCLNCNDEEYRSEMSEEELGKWSLGQLSKGKIIVVVREGNI